ncbi:MAG TPA: sigma-70 family RNA polymerase sigma factor [Phycisphaerae bacterium]|nr:sigma-70 family RNA polymerase sigma factor [Phycisphaerae bacterium]
MPTPHAHPSALTDDWRVWYTRHARALFLLARHHLSDPHLAEDAVQQGFIHFWQSRRRAADPAAYLFTCVRNAALALRRSARTRRRHESALPPPPLFLLPPDDPHESLHHALAHLPPEQREVLLLKIWSSLTFAQIAAALAIPLNTAASRYRYALDHLHTLLSPQVPHE